MICSLIDEQCRNEIEGHKDCINCIIWHQIVRHGDDPEKYKRGEKDSHEG